MGECRLDSWNWRLSLCLPSFCYSHIQCAASWAQLAVASNSPIVKTSPSHRGPDSVLVSVCVLLIYLQDLHVATCSFLLMILKLVMLEKCFASDVLNLDKPFGIRENSSGFPTSIDPRRQKRMTHFNIPGKAEYWRLCYGKWAKRYTIYCQYCEPKRWRQLFY